MNNIIAFPRKIFYMVILAFLLISIYLLFSFFQKKLPVQRVVIITIDTLRADHLGAYGYIHNTSPFFDELSQKGILFKNAFVPMPTTAPSHASLFTSLYPMHHGLLKNGQILDNSFLTMAEIFKKKGYKTAGIVSTNVHFKVGNIDQGFEYFNEPDQSDLIKSPYRQAQDTINVAIKWLDTTNKTDKLFLWIHLYDPHIPLQPPESYYNKLKNLPIGEFSDFLINKQHIDLSFYNNDRERMLNAINLYDAEILYADTEIKRFFNYYQTIKNDSKTLWVITADHGEGLGNHNWWGHGKHIYNEQLRVPLLFYFSSEVTKGITIENLVENIDIFPSIFEIIDGKNWESPVIDGESLVPLISHSEKIFFKKKFAFCQRRFFDSVPLDDINSQTTNYEKGEKFALQSLEYKYIHHNEGEDAFYNLKNDPYELKNIINSGSDEERKLRDTLFTKIDKLKKGAFVSPSNVDTVTMERLKSLGYIQ
jgi:arylsulfatase A-like enzyme